MSLLKAQGSYIFRDSLVYTLTLSKGIGIRGPISNLVSPALLYQHHTAGDTSKLGPAHKKDSPGSLEGPGKRHWNPGATKQTYTAVWSLSPAALSGVDVADTPVLPPS